MEGGAFENVTRLDFQANLYYSSVMLYPLKTPPSGDSIDRLFPGRLNEFLINLISHGVICLVSILVLIYD